jgi:hypothetical protein
MRLFLAFLMSIACVTGCPSTDDDDSSVQPADDDDDAVDDDDALDDDDATDDDDGADDDDSCHHPTGQVLVFVTGKAEANAEVYVFLAPPGRVDENGIATYVEEPGWGNGGGPWFDGFAADVAVTPGTYTAVAIVGDAPMQPGKRICVPDHAYGVTRDFEVPTGGSEVTVALEGVWTEEDCE